MGYSDADVRVYIDVLGPLYIVPGPIVVASTYIIVWDTQAEGMP